ncbi:MAG: carbohydrate-binding domain-containing protein [Clostridia bacterium]|nr:carbohydrate-binding domain-containing protein [Clostridia bacterium]
MKIRSKFKITLTLVLSALLLCSCGAGNATDPAAQDESSDTTAKTGAVDLFPPTDTEESETDESAILSIDAESAALLGLDVKIRDEWDGKEGTPIVFDGDKVMAGSGVTVDGTTVTVTQKGTYVISGHSENGQIVVDLAEDKNVMLVLNGLDLTSADSAPIYVKNAKNTTICLAPDSENILSDGGSITYDDAEAEEPNATVFSKDDLIVNGQGSLTVEGDFNNGIQSKDDLHIQNGKISVTALNNAVKGKDSVVISGGELTVVASGDGIQASNTEDATRGYVAITGGRLVITAECDGIQGERAVNITGGSLDITTGGGAGVASTDEESGWGDWGMGGPGGRGHGPGGMGGPGGRDPFGTAEEDSTDDTPSAKAIKTSGIIHIGGGEINIDSSDDSIHSNDLCTISGGRITAKSGDDGIHADDTLTLSGGEITITQSYEGIEAQIIKHTGSIVSVTASDDGYNANGGNDMSPMGRPGQNGFANNTGSDVGNIEISGGSILVNASGDGIDANGSIVMTDGRVIVNGPTNGGNGPLDYQYSFTVSGGTLVAVGSSQMAQSVSTEGNVGVIAASMGNLGAGELVGVLDPDGNAVFTFRPEKSYSCIVYASADILSGAAYTVCAGGEYSGGKDDSGILTDGSWSGYTELGTLEA